MTAILEAHELYRFFHAGDDETQALRGVSIAIEPGEFVALVGPSGSGKTTLLNCLAGLDDPDGGYVKLAGRRISRRPERERAALRARSIGMLLQTANLFEHLSVDENVALQLAVALRSTAPRAALLERLGIARRHGARPTQLSGGETARAGLAVALATEPALLLADEPTGEVDAATERDILQLLRERRGAGMAALVATHSAAVASFADRTVRLLDGRVASA